MRERERERERGKREEKREERSNFFSCHFWGPNTPIALLCSL
jgi:hypothetical protein